MHFRNPLGRLPLQYFARRLGDGSTAARGHSRLDSARLDKKFGGSARLEARQKVPRLVTALVPMGVLMPKRAI